jgi:MEDS: MEthanogen/methylotroph, DcmR Sensory domain
VLAGPWSGTAARHALLCYDSQERLRARAVPYVREGLARGEAVTAVVAAEVAQLLGAALGDDTARVRWQAGRLSASGGDVRRVPAVPRRAARRWGAHAAARPEELVKMSV